jgi:large conductance mechanosensitive channel
MSFTSEFRDFIAKGNVIDLAVGVIIGAAFGKVVDSLVADVIMPPLGLLIGDVNFTELQWKIKPEEVDAAGKVIPAIAIKYGNLIQNCFTFIVMALAIFTIVVKPINRLKRKTEATPPIAPPAPTKEQVLLAEIRDLLKK